MQIRQPTVSECPISHPEHNNNYKTKHNVSCCPAPSNQYWQQAATDVHYTATNKPPCEEQVRPSVPPLCRTLTKLTLLGKAAHPPRASCPLSRQHHRVCPLNALARPPPRSLGYTDLNLGLSVLASVPRTTRVSFTSRSSWHLKLQTTSLSKTTKTTWTST